jgi:hypothetical protein
MKPLPAAVVTAVFARSLAALARPQNFIDLPAIATTVLKLSRQSVRDLIQTYSIGHSARPSNGAASTWNYHALETAGKTDRFIQCEMSVGQTLPETFDRRESKTAID